MLQPVMTVPSAASSAAPTLKFENAALGVLPRAPRRACDADADVRRLEPQRRPMTPSSSAMNEPRTRRAVSITSSWTSGWSSTPAAMLVMHEMPSTSTPRCRAAIASGAVDMPTASAPSVRKARISAGVS